MDENLILDFPTLTGFKVNENDSIIGDIESLKFVGTNPEEVENFFKEIDGQTRTSTATFACQSESVPKEDTKLFESIYAPQFRQKKLDYDITNLSKLLLNNEHVYKHNVEVKKENDEDAVEAFEETTLRDCKFQTCVDDDVQKTSKLVYVQNNGFNSNNTVQQHIKRNLSSDMHNMQIDQDGDTPLHIFVAHCGNISDTKAKANELRSKKNFYGVFVNIQNNQRQTPLHLAVEMGNLYIIQVLMEFGANINMFDDHLESPLHAVLRTKCRIKNKPQLIRDIVRLLLSSDNMKHEEYNLDAKNEKGLSAMHLAVMIQDLELIKMLWQKGADINERENKCGLTPIMLLINQAKNERNRKQSLQLAQTIITQIPVDVNKKSFSGDSPLHLACACDCLGLVKALVDKGATVNEKNVYKKTEKDLTSQEVIRKFLEIHFRKKRRKRKHEEDN